MAQMYRILGKRGRVTIPYAIRQRVGFICNDVLSFTESEDGRAVIVRRERLCDSCAVEQEERESTATVTLRDFIDSLTPEQQKAALAHLKRRWDTGK